jgi:hypothetical protein
MKYFIDVNQFKKYLKNMIIDTENAAVSLVDLKDFKAVILMESRMDYKERITVEFSIKFEYKREKETKVFQREFKIEHHLPDKSIHSKPHVQIYGHGPNSMDKVGELWITLDIEDEGQYVACIEGFLNLLPRIIDLCEQGLADSLLNIELLENLKAKKDFLKLKINESLKSNLIQFKDVKGNKFIVDPKKLPTLLEKDKLLIPFFG